MAWGILIVAGLLEIVWALALKQAEGFTRLGPSVVGVVTALASLYLLASALQALPVATAYAVWVGIGVAGVAVVGSIAFGEPVTVLRASFLVLILVGVIGLRVIEG